MGVWWYLKTVFLRADYFYFQITCNEYIVCLFACRYYIFYHNYLLSVNCSYNVNYSCHHHYFAFTSLISNLKCVGFTSPHFLEHSSVLLTAEWRECLKTNVGDNSFSIRLNVTRNGRFKKKGHKVIKVTVVDLCFHGNTQNVSVSKKRKKKDINSGG